MRFPRPFAIVACLGLSLSMPAPAPAAVADFDDFVEGFLGTQFTDGGIRFFFNPDDYAPGAPSRFAIDNAEQNLGPRPFFSKPNGLGIDGLVPGPNGGGNRFGAMSMALEDGRRARAASVELFMNLLDGANRMLLVARGSRFASGADSHEAHQRRSRMVEIS